MVHSHCFEKRHKICGACPGLRGTKLCSGGALHPLAPPSPSYVPLLMHEMDT